MPPERPGKMRVRSTAIRAAATGTAKGAAASATASPESAALRFPAPFSPAISRLRPVPPHRSPTHHGPAPKETGSAPFRQIGFSPSRISSLLITVSLFSDDFLPENLVYIINYFIFAIQFKTNGHESSGKWKTHRKKTATRPQSAGFSPARSPAVSSTTP